MWLWSILLLSCRSCCMSLWCIVTWTNSTSAQTKQDSKDQPSDVFCFYICLNQTGSKVQPSPPKKPLPHNVSSSNPLSVHQFNLLHFLYVFIAFLNDRYIDKVNIALCVCLCLSVCLFLKCGLRFNLLVWLFRWYVALNWALVMWAKALRTWL